MNGIGTTGMNDLRDPISEWKACLPSDVDRLIYIKNCFLTNTITIANENGEIKNGVRIDKMNLQLIDFPEDVDQFGSDLICVKAPYSGKLYVVGVYSTAKQYASQKEDQLQFKKSNGIGTAGILIDGRGNIICTIDGDEDNGKFIINVTNKDRKGEFKINVNGELIIENDGNTVITSSGSFKAIYKNGEEESYVQVNQDRVLINSKKILLNDSEEPMLLGTKTVDLIESILNQLGKESAGPYPLLGQQIYLNLVNQLEDLKSTISFVK